MSYDDKEFKTIKDFTDFFELIKKDRFYDWVPITDRIFDQKSKDTYPSTSSKYTTIYVKKDKMPIFHRVISESGGRYIRNPEFSEVLNSYQVCYESGNKDLEVQLLALYSTRFVEVKRPKWVKLVSKPIKMVKFWIFHIRILFK